MTDATSIQNTTVAMASVTLAAPTATPSVASGLPKTRSASRPVSPLREPQGPTDAAATAIAKAEGGDAAVVVHDTFDSMGLPDELLRGIFAYGFEKPSAIQQRAIVPLAEGKDLIGQAQSGTGKTAAFAIGLLRRLDVRAHDVQAIVLAPTRELANQIFKVVGALGEYMGVNVMACVGGARLRDNIEVLRRGGVHVVVGTPGRVYDLINRRVLYTDKVKVFVLDEADEMLGVGFQDQIYDIFRFMPKEAQVALFSATLPEAALAITERFMREPVKVLVKAQELTLEGIRQFYVMCEREEYKLDTLMDLYETVSISQAKHPPTLPRRPPSPVSPVLRIEHVGALKLVEGEGVQRAWTGLTFLLNNTARVCALFARPSSSPTRAPRWSGSRGR